MTKPTRSVAESLLVGALAGAGATTAMTLVMVVGRSLLNQKEQYPLPPREITEQILPVSTERCARSLSLLSHYGYGAATGAFLGLARRPAALGGAGYGILIWMLSYLGWIPLLGVLRPGTEHPARRNALMISAHIVWGLITAMSVGILNRSLSEPFAKGPLNDALRERARDRHHVSKGAA